MGCSPKPEEKTAMPTSIGPVISTTALSRLEEADKPDGVTDHVIGKCYVCGLGMDGSEKFAVKVQGTRRTFAAKLARKNSPIPQIKSFWEQKFQSGIGKNR